MQYLYNLRSFNPDVLNDAKAEILIAIAERLERIAELMEHSDEHQQDIEAKLLTFGQEEEPWRERDEAHPDLGLHPVWDDNLE